MALPIPPGSSARGNLWAFAMWRAGLQEACAVKPPNGSESPRCVVTGLPRQSPDRTRPLSPARGMPAPAAPLSGLAAGGEPDPGRHQQELRAQPCPPPAGCRRPQRGARPCPALPRRGPPADNRGSPPPPPAITAAPASPRLCPLPPRAISAPARQPLSGRPCPPRGSAWLGSPRAFFRRPLTKSPPEARRVSGRFPPAGPQLFPPRSGAPRAEARPLPPSRCSPQAKERRGPAPLGGGSSPGGRPRGSRGRGAALRGRCRDSCECAGPPCPGAGIPRGSVYRPGAHPVAPRAIRLAGESR